MAGGNGRCLIRNEVCTSDTYLGLSNISRDLYIQLLLSADFEGFIGRIKTESAMSMVKAKSKNLNQLIEKGYILEFPSKVTLIVHWWILNTFDKREAERKTNQTIYQQEKSMIMLDDNGLYRFIPNDLRITCEGKQTNLKEDKIKQTNKQTNPVSPVGLSDDSIFFSLNSKDSESLKAKCKENDCDLSELIRLVDDSIRNRKDQTPIRNPYRYILQVAEDNNWNLSEIRKSYLPSKNVKRYGDIKGSLWDILNDSDKTLLKAQYQYEKYSIEEITKDVDGYIKRHPLNEYTGTEISLFKTIADKRISEGIGEKYILDGGFKPDRG